MCRFNGGLDVPGAAMADMGIAETVDVIMSAACAESRVQ